jgi:hypothetical protein
MLGWSHRVAPWFVGEGGIQIGPIPKGTPINLLANLKLLPDVGDPTDPVRHGKDILELLVAIKRDLSSLPPDATDEQARQKLANLREPLLELSKCPDFVVNRGHYFGTDMSEREPGLSDQDKRALIEFLKTF